MSDNADRDAHVRERIERILSCDETATILLPILDAIGGLAEGENLNSHAACIQAPRVVSVITVSDLSSFDDVRKQFLESLALAERAFRQQMGITRNPSAN